MKSLNDIEKRGLKEKKVFLRVDFNVPVTDGEVGEKYRIQSHHKDTIDFLLAAGVKVALVSHIDGNFKDIAVKVEEILGHQLDFEEDILNPKLDSQLTLFENIRKYEGEEINDSGFAEDLARNFDLYVNDAFSVSHREHASVSTITGFLPSYAGFLIEKEIRNLERVLNEPAQGKTIILGGAKVSTKLPVIKNFLDPEGVRQGGPYGVGAAEHILVAGALANTVFKKKGIKIGKSTAEEVEEDLDWSNSKIVLPKDIVVSNDRSGRTVPQIFPVKDIDEDQMILDIGPETVKHFSEIIGGSETIIFNGPVGLAEVDAFSIGTRMVLDSIIRSGAFSVVGGGNTLALFEKWGLIGKFGYVSTGGGAMLDFLAGNRLPGLEALGYYE